MIIIITYCECVSTHANSYMYVIISYVLQTEQYVMDLLSMFDVNSTINLTLAVGDIVNLDAQVTNVSVFIATLSQYV